MNLLLAYVIITAVATIIFIVAMRAKAQSNL